MGNEATIELYATLDGDIFIAKSEGEIEYGLATVSINTERKTNQIPIAVWNRELLSANEHLLKKGTSVLITGEVSAFNNFLSNKLPVNSTSSPTKMELGENSITIENEYSHKETMLINITSAHGIKTLH